MTNILIIEDNINKLSQKKLTHLVTTTLPKRSVLLRGTLRSHNSTMIQFLHAVPFRGIPGLCISVDGVRYHWVAYEVLVRYRPGYIILMKYDGIEKMPTQNEIDSAVRRHPTVDFWGMSGSTDDALEFVVHCKNSMQEFIHYVWESECSDIFSHLVDDTIACSGCITKVIFGAFLEAAHGMEFTMNGCACSEFTKTLIKVNDFARKGSNRKCRLHFVCLEIGPNTVFTIESIWSDD